MRRTILPLVIVAFTLLAMKADKDAYRIFDKKGKKASYAKLFKKATEADVILFGELHNNPIWVPLATASVRFVTSNFSRICRICVFTVFSEI